MDSEDGNSRSAWATYQDLFQENKRIKKEIRNVLGSSLPLIAQPVDLECHSAQTVNIGCHTLIAQSMDLECHIAQRLFRHWQERENSRYWINLASVETTSSEGDHLLRLVGVTRHKVHPKMLLESKEYPGTSRFVEGELGQRRTAL